MTDIDVDALREEIGWPRCPECKQWMDPGTGDHSVWRCASGEHPVEVLWYPDSSKEGKWRLLSGRDMRRGRYTDPPKLAPQVARGLV